MTAENARKVLEQMKKDHDMDFSNLGHSESKLPLGCGASDEERYANMRRAAISFAAQFPDNEFAQSIFIGALISAAEFQIKGKNERIDQVVGEIRQLHEMSNNTEIDINQMDRKLEWLNTLTEQRIDMEMSEQHVKIAFKSVTGKEYVKRSRESAEAANKRRDANMTKMQVASLLAAVDKGEKITPDVYGEEAAIAAFNAKHPGRKSK